MPNAAASETAAISNIDQVRAGLTNQPAGIYLLKMIHRDGGTTLQKLIRE